MGTFAASIRSAAIIAAALLPCVALAQNGAGESVPDTIEITPWTAAEFGGEGGDALSLERLTPTGAVVLLNPHGEGCTLRFSMRVGERLVVRGATNEGKQAVCRLLLTSTTQDVTAIFSYECLDQSPLDEKRCAP